MARRFGRNQKRRMREALAIAQVQADNATRGAATDRANAEAWRLAVERAVRLLGANSMAMPAPRFELGRVPESWETLKLHERRHYGLRSGLYEDRSAIRELDLVIAKVRRNPDNWTPPGYHARVTCRGQDVAYAMDARTLARMGAEDAARLMAEELAPLLVEGLKKELQARPMHWDYSDPYRATPRFGGAY